MRSICRSLFCGVIGLRPNKELIELSASTKKNKKGTDTNKLKRKTVYWDGRITQENAFG